MSVTVTDRRVDARGLSFHLREWTPSTRASARTVYLSHGFADAVGTWDETARAVAERGFRVVGHDHRGFGGSGWISRDAYYHFFDYVADMDALLPREGGADVVLVGHSMGGTVACQYAGSRPSRVARLVLLEGLGPPDSDPAYAPERAERWLDDLASFTRDGEKTYDHERALARLQKQHERVPRETLAKAMPSLVKEAPGGVAWRMDPLHRTMAPVPFYVAAFKAFAARVRCPVWLVDGGEEGFHPPDEGERIGAFRDARVRSIEGAGHMMHWTRPDDVAAAVGEAASS